MEHLLNRVSILPDLHIDSSAYFLRCNGTRQIDPAGGIIAKKLCEGGARVIMLEAGQRVDPRYLSHKWPYGLLYHGLRGEQQALFYPKDICRDL